LESLKRLNEDKLLNAKREVSNMQEVYESKVDGNLRKVKRELADKSQENQRISNQLSQLKSEYETEIM
jgi:hypothetical protein